MTTETENTHSVALDESMTSDTHYRAEHVRQAVKENAAKSIFNADRGYGTSSWAFLGEGAGLFDTINKPAPEIYQLYLQAAEQFWMRNEFDFSPCAAEFARGDDAAQIMIDTIAYQWEADSSAANAMLPVLAPFITNSDLQQLVSFNCMMECCHAESYSEMVRESFSNPREVIDEILANKESLDRLTVMATALQALSDAGIQYRLGNISKEDVYPILYKGVVALFLLERMQFIASFAITFALGEAGMFIPIANCVRKICSDEVQIHAQTNTLMLRELRKLPFWENYKDDQSFNDDIASYVEDVINQELWWTDKLFEGRSLPGTNAQLIKDWVIYNAQAVKEELGIPFKRTVKENPIPWINNWISLNNVQQAMQESDGLNYKIGGVDHSDNEDIEIDF